MSELKEIPGFKNYRMDEFANIYSIYTKRGKTNPSKLKKIKPAIRKQDGRVYVSIVNNDGLIKTRHISRLFALTFIDNPQNLPIVMHKDNNLQNNSITNLKWGTISENNKQAFDEKRKKPTITRGWDNYNTKYSIEIIKNIIKDRMSGYSLKQINKKYGTSMSHVRRILNGETYFAKQAKIEQISLFEL